MERDPLPTTAAPAPVTASVPGSGSAPGSEVGSQPQGTVTLAAVRDTPLSVDEVLAAVAHPAAGGTVVFVGTVRDHDGGRDVAGLDYSGHPSAPALLREVAESIVAVHQVRTVAAVHRVGRLAVGDLAVVTAVTADHRAEAFAACRELIDVLKQRVPIWKDQSFADGSHEWVGSL